MLSPKGRLVGEFSVSQLSPEEFLLVGSGTADRYHHRIWETHLPAEGVSVESMTTKLCGFSVSGPNARTLLEKLCDTDISAETWKYGRVGRVQMGPAADAILSRVAYTGELGYEVLVPYNSHLPLLEALLRAGADLGVKLAGIRALNSLRIEKGYGAWGLEYAPDYTPFEAGMARLVKFDKGDFVGREAALVARDAAPRWTYRQFDIATTDAEPWGGEPVMRDGRVVALHVTKRHAMPDSVAVGGRGEVTDHAGTTDGLYVDILGDRREVTVRTTAAFDAEGKRMRG
jgi:dimethylglycine dehydrogenase